MLIIIIVVVVVIVIINAVIFAAAVSIINVIMLQVIDYDRHIFVHLLLSCADSVISSSSCWVSTLK
jgi:hypothetical protein